MRRPGTTDPRSGFALLITITLLAFLVLLLVSLASLTRVETQVADNNQKLAQARANALAGLNIALGQLQKYAGPDRRVTARAELAGSAVKQPWFTGIWDATATTLAAATPSVWLVSGNEGSDPRAITPSTLDPATAAADDEVFVIGDHTAADTAGRVKVRKQTLSTASVPGLAGTQTIGHYAYWIGDEGVKAKVSLLDEHASVPVSSTTADDERRYSFLAAQRFGVERVADGEDTAVGDDWPSSSVGLARVLTLGQLPQVGVTAAAQTTLQQVIHHRYHDLTAHSFSVLADVAQGGLRKDLTAWLSATGSLPSGAPADDAPLFPAAKGGEDFMMPRWGVIRSWNTLRDDGSARPPRSQTDTEQGLYPVVTFFRLGLAVSQGEIEAAGDPAVPLRPLYLHLFPTVVLWNPTNVKISGDYEVCFVTRDNNNRNITFTFVDAGNSTKVFDARFAQWTGADAPATTNAIPYYRFLIKGATLEAGESRVFTLPNAADGVAYEAGVTELVNAFNVANSVIIPTAINLTSAQRASKVTWSSTSAGHELDVVLRAPGNLPTPMDESGVEDWYQLLPGAYHTVQRAGYGTLVGNMPANQPATDWPAGHIWQWQLAARMTTSSDGPRWIAAHNLRAPVSARVAIEGTSHGTHGTSVKINSAAPNFPANGRASAGLQVENATATDLVLTEFLPTGVPLFSLAQLRHANLSPFGFQPTYAVGNSLADYRVPLAASRFDKAYPASTPSNNSHNRSLTKQITATQDLSWLLNEALYDRYFLSTVPDGLTLADWENVSYRLPNARHRLRPPATGAALDSVRGRPAFDTAAAHLLVNGGFNVNSASEQAWRALLSGANGLGYNPGTGKASVAALEHPFSRYAAPSGGSKNEVWGGWRELTPNQIEVLARNIRREVLARGPFRSLADFVNRRIQGLDTSSGSEGGPAFKGALQAAIDRADFDGSTAADQINTDSLFHSTTYYTTGSTVKPTPSGVDSDLTYAAVNGGTGANRPYSSRLAFAPGNLTQADILAAIGPALTARSDTFVIRAYGDARNPATGDIDGRAWCEAVVQRLPEYVDDSLSAWAIPAAGGINTEFGRRFHIVSFRWLGSSEI